MSTTPTSWVAVASVVAPVVVAVAPEPDPEPDPEPALGSDCPGAVPRRRRFGVGWPPAYGLVTREMLAPVALVVSVFPASWAPPTAIAAAEARPAAPSRRGRGRRLNVMELTFEVQGV